MRTNQLACFAALCISVAAFAGQPAAAENPLVKQLIGEADAPTLSPTKLRAAYATAIDAVVAQLTSDDPSVQNDADRKLEAIAYRRLAPTDEGLRRHVVARLAAKLHARPALPVFARRRIVWNLGRIGKAEAVPTLAPLLANPALREYARMGLVRNPAPAAVAALRAALPKAKGAFRIALIDALGTRRDAASLTPLLAIAQAPDAEARAHAVRALARIIHPAAAPAIVAATTKGSPRQRHIAIDAALALADALATKGHKPQAHGIYRSLLGPESHVKCAALLGLGRVGTPDDVDILVAALAGPTAERAAASHALAALPGKGVTKAIAARARSADATTRAGLFDALGRRSTADAVPILVAATRDPDPAVRIAACKALGTLGADEAVPALVAALGKAQGAEQQAIVTALRTIRGEHAIASMIQAARSARPPALAPLLTALSHHQHPGVPPLLLANARHADPAVRAAVLEGLTRAHDPKAVPHILAGAADKPPVRTAAIRAAVHYANPLIQADRAKAATLLTAALDRTLVPDGGDRVRAIRALAAIGGPDVVDRLRADLNAPRGNDAAYATAFAIAQRLAAEGKKPEAIALYTTIMRHRGRNPRRIRTAQKALKALGVQGDLAHRAGFITQWWVCGPFPNPGNALFDKPLPPEKGKVDLTKPVVAEGKTLPWKPVHTTSYVGIVDLAKLMGNNLKGAALLYAEVTVSKPVSVYLRLGYDDDCVGYINGRRIHHHKGRGSLRVDEWRGDTVLKPGVNTIVLKVLNRGGRWSVCARLLERSDIAIDFAQRQE